MQIRLHWRAERRKYKMSDSEEDVMLIGLYVISNKKKQEI